MSTPEFQKIKNYTILHEPDKNYVSASFLLRDFSFL